MIIIREPVSTKNYLVTIAIGEKYLSIWETYAKPQWIKYCTKYDLGLIVIDEDIAKNANETWKKPTWQKLLIGQYLTDQGIDVESICYLDTDILISPYAENVFADYDPNSIGLVSLRNNLPFDYQRTLRSMAYNRHHYYSNSYPLDSALFITVEDLYLHHNMEPQKDEACMGFIVFNVPNHKDMMFDWFHKYDANVYSITGDGDQTHLNYEIQKSGLVQWFDYRFQAIWVFEMAAKYPFLYQNDSIELIKSCLEASLTENHFLHFAGSWHETDMFKTDGLFSDDQKVADYQAYLDETLKGTVLGTVKPE